MRVLQLIDSLRPGGAEQMAVSYANALAKRINGSYLCCTRMEGMLKQRISLKVGYLFLGKNQALDMQAFWKLRKFVKENKIDLIQAHSSSWFLALLVKISVPNIKLVWHDHYGRELSKRKTGILKPASKYFDGIISVKVQLQDWAEQNLYARAVLYVRNFLPDSFEGRSGEKDEFCFRSSPGKAGRRDTKIICVANFRPQKDHLNLLKAFKLLTEENNCLSLHLIGKDLEDDYSREIKKYIRDSIREKKVFMYGEQQEVTGMLRQVDLGVLSSASEGLPVALLEYGRAGLPVVCTRVGECAEVVGETGKLVPPGNPEALAQAIGMYLGDEEQRKKDAAAFHQNIMTEYSEGAVMPEVLWFFGSLCKRPGNSKRQRKIEN